MMTSNKTILCCLQKIPRYIKYSIQIGHNVPKLHVLIGHNYGHDCIFRNSVVNNKTTLTINLCKIYCNCFSLSEFSGATLPGYPTLLVVTMGYDLTRPRDIISELQPTNKIGIMTSPPPI